MKKHLQVITVLCLLALMAFGLCACGSSSKAPTTATPTTATPTTAAPTTAAPTTDASSAKKVSLRLATGGTTGTYYSFGGAIAQTFNEYLDGVNITVHSSGGSKTNIFEMIDGQADLCLAQNDVTYYALTGTDLFVKDGPQKGFSAIAATYPEVFQTVVKPDIKDISELKGKRISIGDAGSGSEFNAHQYLEAYGITDKDYTPCNLNYTDSVQAFKDNKIDAFFCVSGVPTTALVDLLTTAKANFLSMDQEHFDKLVSKHAFYTMYVMAPGTYKGIDYEVKMPAVKSCILVANSVPDDVVYKFTKGLFEYKDKIQHDKAKFLDVNNAVQGLTDIPFHPGAQKYYKEVGVLK